MFKRTIFFTLIYITFTTHAADGKVITLQSNDGDCITIGQATAKHSGTLANLIEDCPNNQVTPLDIFNTQELQLLVNVLNTIHQATSEQNAKASLHAMINHKSEHVLISLHDFFAVEILRQALAEHFFYVFDLHKTEGILEKAAAITKVCENLLASNADENASITTQRNAALVHRLIENTRLIDKENFLTSKGKQIGLLFTGVSVGEAADYGLINTKYKPACIDGIFSAVDTLAHELSNEHVNQVPHLEMRITGDYITSLQGLVAHAPIEIKDKRRSVLIYNTNILHLDSDCFQEMQNPEHLLIYRNKIVSINPRSFCGLNSLKELNLTSNKLTFIPPTLFDPLVNLEMLCLADNQIKSIHANMFKYCKKIKSISLLDTLIPKQEIAALRTALPHVKIYASFSSYVASNYSRINT